jgi:diguanylate cyclase (GGDEF)-like protein/PAS domain S-box-containing protein
MVHAPTSTTGSTRAPAHEGDGAAVAPLGDALSDVLFAGVAQPLALFAVSGRTVRFAAANNAYGRLVQRDAPDLAGEALTAVLRPEDAAVAVEEILAVVEHSEERRYEVTVDLPSGRASIETTLHPLTSLSTEGTRQVLAVTRDLTEDASSSEALRRSEQRFASLATSSPVGVFYMDSRGDLLYANRALREILGLSEAEALGSGWRRALHPDDAADVAEATAALFDGQRLPPIGFRVHRSDGSLRRVEVRSSPVRDAGTGIVGFVGTMEDLTDRMASETVARQLTDIVEATSDQVGISDPDGRCTYLNAAGREFHGFAPDDDVSDLLVLDMYTGWSRRRFTDEVLPTLRRDGMWRGELAIRSLSTGAEIHVSQVISAHRDDRGEVRYYSSIARDISERKAFEEQLARQALHDPLTGLPNRALFTDRLTQALARATRLGSDVIVVFLDVDRFKLVNDSLGHDAGDQVLRELGERLRRVLRPSDTVARLGGDEFVALCEDVAGEPDVIAMRVEDALRPPFEVADGEVFVTASIGVTRAADPAAVDAETMLRDADAAMYRAKQRGRARFEVFDERMRVLGLDHLETENELRRAIDRGELLVHYQPLVSLDEGRVIGVEALVRWRHPRRGMLLPAEFVPLAEDAGLIVPLGEWVLGEACSQIARWREERPGWAPTLWVNLSARQLNHLGLVETIERALAEHGVEEGAFGLEITESVLMEEPEATAVTLRVLADMGVAIAIDDFGTGYSSLSHLKQFPVHTLKVDQSFVDGLGREPEDSAIVTAQVSMAQALGIKVVAEGVENVTQLEALRRLRCDHAQGYLFAPALPAGALSELLDLEPRW